VRWQSRSAPFQINHMERNTPSGVDTRVGMKPLKNNSIHVSGAALIEHAKLAHQGLRQQISENRLTLQRSREIIARIDAVLAPQIVPRVLPLAALIAA
jgi:hypothetical protein